MIAEPDVTEPWIVISEDDPQPTPADRRWRRVVRSLYRIRRLQRIFGHLGQWLQTFDGDLRKSLQRRLK